MVTGEKVLESVVESEGRKYVCGAENRKCTGESLGILEEEPPVGSSELDSDMVKRRTNEMVANMVMGIAIGMPQLRSRRGGLWVPGIVA